MSNPSDISKSTISSAKPKKTLSLTYNSLSVVKVLVVILVVVIAFWLGMFYANHHRQSSTPVSAASGFGLRRSGGLGTVSAVSSSSITIMNQRSGQSNTYSITSSTKITDNGQTTTTSSITDGERVIVISERGDGSVAATILVNPSFGGFGATQSSGSSTAGSTTTQ